MRIALCFSGIPRVVKETYQSVKDYIINPNEIDDIFIHCWTFKNGQEIGNRFWTYKYDRSNENFILKNYNPKLFISEYQKNLVAKKKYLPEKITKKYKRDCYSLFDKQSQFYSLYRSVKLMSEYQEKFNFVYDYVIYLRFDLMFTKPINVKKLNRDKLYVSNFCSRLKQKDKWVNDWMAIGKPKLLQQYSNLWNNLYDCLEKGIVFHPERLVGKNIINYNIPVIPLFKEGENHYLYRGNGKRIDRQK